MADDFDKFLPARFGTAQGKSIERTMFEQVGDPMSQQTVEQLHADGSITRLRTHGGMLRFVHYGVDEEEDEELISHLPDIMSGVVIGGFYDPDQPTLAGVLRTTPYSALQTGMHTGALWKTNRLAVPLSERITTPTEFSSAVGITQYTVVQPYKYTGKMRSLVQWLLGAGKMPASSRYDTLLTLPTTCIPTQESGTNVQISYNYRFNQSHGLTIGADGHPWVILIDQALGVWAFLLPRIHGSDLPSFYEAMTDAELSALDEFMVAWPLFKGIPTGENITPETLAAWEKSGCAIKLLDVSAMGVFGESQGVATQLGWAFDYTGNEARVIAVKHVTGPGVDYDTAHYLRLTFAVGAVRAPLNTTAVQAIRAKYIVPGAPAHVRLKAHYMSDLDAYNVLNGHVTFDAVVSAPIASAAASFSELESSVFYAPPSQVKVWDDAIGFCLSLGLDERTGAPAGVSTVPLHVFYDKSNTLRELRIKPQAGDISAGPYIVDVFDTTGPSNGSTTTTNESDTRYTGISSYYISVLPASDFHDGWFRYWWSTKTDTSEVKPGNETNGCAFVPCGDRESVIFAKKNTHNQGTKSFNYTFNSGNRDRVAYRLFDNYIMNEIRDGTVRLIQGCWLQDTDMGDFVSGLDPIYSEETLETGPGGDSWASACVKPYQATYPNPDASLIDHTDVVPSGGTVDVQVFADGQLQPVLTASGGKISINTDYGIWFAPSTPMPEDAQVMRVTSNCLGSSSFVQCYDDINSGHYKTFGTLPMPEVESSDYQFNYIGVVQ